MQQLLAFTHRDQLRSRLHARPVVLASAGILLPAEAEAFASGAKDARCIVLDMLPGHCLDDTVSGGSAHQSDAALHTLKVGRVDVVVPIHLLLIVVVRLRVVGIVATISVVRMVLLASRMGFSRTPLQLVQPREHLIGHDAAHSLARPVGFVNDRMQSYLCCL